MQNREAEHARLLDLAAKEDAAADAALRVRDDGLVISQYRKRAAYFRQQAKLLLLEGDG
ncbi:hypothetical protein [Sphingobium sp. WCS2017Hpa-17]|uniref:hypothetical protein n=1 Tax=Sphingobium sp. WCS2017Hpa-17 TaxID=3073638 RepID=UPI0028890A0F|nr:hypothetical protein [Sphingobium sp. WCS2017Hpa-17]